ncbi:unnamed protein product [Chironomus riparius]|uniref:Uncharacterized protein n=1 Tax=Chironomus riparius TaxID=315576 RepID=A0A9N9X0E6_9DIPT|nr:unnamed protein product [Chironomus riparius]
MSYLSFLRKLFIIFCIVQHSQPATLNCKYEQLYRVYFGYGYHCEVINLEIFSNSSTFDAEIGDHKDGKCNNDVVWVIMVENSVNQHSMLSFPKGFKIIYPNLIAISIMNMGLKRITAEDLKPFPNLQHLILWKNNLTFIEEDLFQHNPGLESLSLSSNQIFHIDPQVLSHLGSLKWLRLEGNRCNGTVEIQDATRRDRVVNLVKIIEDGNCVNYPVRIQSLKKEIGIWKGKFEECDENVLKN